MPGITLPPFPDDIPTHPLLVVDFPLLKAGDIQQIDALWKAATELGFWYLKNHGADHEVDEMFKMGEETMGLPVNEKLKFEQGDDVQSFGYKAAGASATDEYGNPDNVEFINVAKDDALAYPSIVHRTYPSSVNACMDSTIRPFVRKSIEVNNTVLSVFEKKLGLPTGMLLDHHALRYPSGCEARVIKSPPFASDTAARQYVKEKVEVALGAHTDFGSLSFLHNRLGGLQVLPPGSDNWQYVRPLPGHALCNIGDALTLLSGGILRSNLHRVVPPPGAQAMYERWSLVFFTRPGNNVPLRMLKDASEMIKNAAERMTLEERHRFETNATAGEWLARRKKNRRIRNRIGPETWQESKGMEHKPQV
ncbi:Clavaminate synthase-like protein [Phellopilus nigrolimitatus]|nr:Clavaminate synthase-like protein [Phellopilus nigrolimitatus]